MQTQTAMIITGQRMFYWEPIVFVLYHCWLCKNPIVEAGIQVTSKDGTKQKKCASIDPFALSKLPNIFAEQFEFMAIESGLGMHESMIARLATRSVLFRMCVHMINELHAIDYYRPNKSVTMTLCGLEGKYSKSGCPSMQII
jgi:hypothetical protein